MTLHCGFILTQHSDCGCFHEASASLLQVDLYLACTAKLCPSQNLGVLELSTSGQ
jgi:hypothetical protein